MSRKLVYTAGPYRSKNGVDGIWRNILAARDVARILWVEMRIPCICPHANTFLMDGPDSDEIFLSGDLVMLERCDAIVMVGAWHDSEGAKIERRHAETHGLKVFYWPKDRQRLAEWATE